ncbi:MULTISPECIES: agmatine deiminase family protein [unclassified Kitasatospora]|uniref:agmatine deiminase family protein n=1 Tax=unclassified Kitasatospora TaxID=2633591 RepID=UPI00070FC7EF|nr:MULTISPECIES: agmatine deiminase family protein [unclassified Kitasatospora]KQV21669.1 peptidyl-arginine deiminase [Kitasatospora sp. Root107]KRB77486.1 peptidyl-arginine deiminase [Kitasatospora sp. Root187]
MNTPVPTRRSLLKLGAAALPLATFGAAFPATARAATAPSGATLRMPAETDRHTRTYMAWPALQSVWDYQLSAVRRDIANVAYEISRYEPVVLLARPEQAADARYTCGSGAYFPIEVEEIANDDLWIRDFGPTFVAAPGAIAGVDTNFNGWGKTGTSYYQPFRNDAAAAATLLGRYGLDRIKAPFVGEGGSLETDGEGTLLATVSSLVNPNRNPGMSQAQVESALKSSLGLDKVIWVPGLAGQDTTDCHIDCLARFTAPGRVLLDQPGPGTDARWVAVYQEAKRVLENATDARGRRLQITELPGPDRQLIRGRGKDFLSSYSNYCTVNGAVIAPQFGDRYADGVAYAILQAQYPDRRVVQLNIDAIASGGGGIHCATQSEPAVPPAA